MHDHNNDKNNSSMWRMMLGCIALLAILFFAGGSLSSAGILWPVLIGIFVAAHFWMMLRGHRSHSDNHPRESNDDPRTQDDAQSVDGEHEGHKGHDGCCK